jgi:hypothetical protein
MRRRIFTKVGVEETMDDPRWMSPAHTISIEIDAPRGIKRVNVAGIRSQTRPIVTGKLSDKKIDKYKKEGRYGTWKPKFQM